MKLDNVTEGNPQAVAAAWVQKFYDEESNPPSLEVLKGAAIGTVNNEAVLQRILFEESYRGFGDYLAVYSAVHAAIENHQLDIINQIEAATTIGEVEMALADLNWPDTPTEPEIEVDVGESLTAKEEAKQFLNDNPNAQLLLALSPAELEAAIENRSAAQETLLLKTLAFAVRYLYQITK